MGVGLNKVVVTELSIYSKDDVEGDNIDEDETYDSIPFEIDEFIDE